PRHRINQIEDLQGNVTQNDDGAQGDGPELRQDHLAEYLPFIGPVHPGRLPALFRNGPQPRQIHGHRRSGQLPDGGDHHGDQRQGNAEGDLPPLHAGNHPGIHVPLGKPLQSPFLQQQVDPRGGVEDPLPYHTRNDERQGHGKNEDIAKPSLGPDATVQQYRQKEAQTRRQKDEEYRKYQRVAQIGLESEIVKQIEIVFQPRPGPIGDEGIPFREGDSSRPPDKPVNEDRHRQKGGQYQQKRQPLFFLPHSFTPSPLEAW